MSNAPADDAFVGAITAPGWHIALTWDEVHVAAVAIRDYLDAQHQPPRHLTLVPSSPAPPAAAYAVEDTPLIDPERSPA